MIAEAIRTLCRFMACSQLRHVTLPMCVVGYNTPDAPRRLPSWVKIGKPQSEQNESGLPHIADMKRTSGHVGDGPCVDGSWLARVFFASAALVGAAMCSAFERGTRGRWP